MIMETTQAFSAHFQVAEIDLVYTPTYKVSDRPKITSPNDSYHVLRSAWNAGKIQLVEEFKVLLLNRGNHVLGIFNASVGGITYTTADIRLIFAAALKAGATAIILAHNHPSGTLIPSVADRDLTKRIKQVGELLEITLLDHLILTSESYYSFVDQGQL